VLKYAPELEEEFRKRKKPVGPSWRVDETYVKVKGHWKYLYRAVDKEGATLDFLLTAKRDVEAAKRFFKKSIHLSGMAEKVTIDKSGANILEKDHRAIKRKIRPMLGFKSFRSATKTISGIEIMHMIRMGQMPDSRNLTHSEQFYSLAG
jgi:transposase-like protein